MTGARNDGINLLRGIAVGLVMLRHAFPDVFAGAGVVGVVMFFALSGHLITGVLLTELEASGGVRLRRFALRRAARLVPALVVMIAIFALVTVVVDPLDDKAELGRTVIVALTWTANLPFPHGSDATFHLWTLAMEEQFYLIWPALLVVAWRAKRMPAVLAGLAALSVGLCILSLIWAGENPDLVYTFPTSWALCFIIGAASRILRDRLSMPPVVAAIALAAILVMSVLPVRGQALTYLLWAPLIALLTSALISHSWRQWGTIGSRVLKPLIALGTVSYAAYLWNYPLTLWLRDTVSGAELIAAALTVGAACASWWLVEKPVARLVSRQRERERTA